MEAEILITEKEISPDKVKKVKRFFRVLLIITIILLLIAICLSIYTDGLGLAFGIIFPFSFLILILLIVGLVKGIRNRKIFANWYAYLFLIIGLTLFLWTPPLFRPTRAWLEQTWRWNDRCLVVEAIRSGKLIPADDNGRIAVPLETYGFISFENGYMGNTKISNVVRVTDDPETGMVVTFTTHRGFFCGDEVICYVENPVNKPGLENGYWKDEHWYAGTTHYSFFSIR